MKSTADRRTVIVVGAGMGGLVAAVQAQELGADVVLVEKGDAAGGTLAMSGGTLWAADSPEQQRKLVPLGDPLLGRVLTEEFQIGVNWLRSGGANLEQIEAPPYRGIQRSIYFMAPGPGTFVSHMVERFIAGGGRLVVNAAARSLLTNSDGRVVGVVVRRGERLEPLSGDAVILATGGFQGDPERMARYFGPWSDRFVLRASPRSTGDGIRLATAVGAASSKAMSSFYGHLLTAPPAQIPTNDFLSYTHNHSEHSLMINLRGQRFADESLGDELNVQAAGRQPEAAAFLVFDHEVYQKYAVLPDRAGARAVDKFKDSAAIGGRTASADSIDDLADALSEWGVHAPGFVETFYTFDRAARAGATDLLQVPRRGNTRPLDRPPYYAIAVTPGITFTRGGIRVDGDGRALDTSGLPVPGLYVAGVDVGGVHNESYGGGLCLGLVFGRRAAQHAINGTA